MGSRARASAVPRRLGVRRVAGRGSVLALLAMLAFGSAAADSPNEKAAGHVTNLALVRSVADEAVKKLLADLAPTGPRVRVRVDPYHETAWMVEELVGQGLRARGLTVVSEPAPKPVPPAPPAGTPPGTPPGAPPPNTPSLSELAQQQQSQTTSDSAAAQADSIPPAAPPGSLGGAPPAATSAPVSPPEPPRVPVDAELRLRVVDLGLKYTGSHRTRPFFGEKQISRYAAASLHGELRDPAGDFVTWSGNGDASRIDEVPKGALPILEGQNYPFTPPALPAQSTGKILEPIVVTAVIVGLVFLFVSNRS